MGISTFLLDRRTATLMVAGSRQTVGTLRRFFKLTEIDDARAAALEAAARVTPSPVAALIMDIVEMPVAGEPGRPVAAHLVLGWDEGRGSVTDYRWDYLPSLGYAVRNGPGGDYVLHEEHSGLLHPIDAVRAHALGLIGPTGQMIRHGQPRIVTCRSVRPYIRGYAEADCTFDRGLEDKLLIATSENELPAETWFIGKRPMDVQIYQRKSAAPP